MAIMPEAPTREPEVWGERIPEFNPLLGHVAEAPPVAVSPEFAAQDFNIDTYLAEQGAKDLLRFSTAGSVDDGKSTLIGRLLYDTQSVYDDQVRAIEGKGTTGPGVLDLALLTDGLRAEREQGITIDVAYRYFSTAKRKFIIADTPGHEQYTRNMATGASTASVAVVLIDARKGVLIQSRRHACITALLGVPYMVVAVNKMDLVGYEEAAFRRIEAEFTGFLEQLGELRPAHLYFVPVSALTGENVVHPATQMPWYTGQSLLELLETVPAVETGAGEGFRFAVQRVLRPSAEFRGFAGQIAAGTVRQGDAVTVLPSGRSGRVGRIVTFSGDLQEARAPQSVVLTLEQELDISRGDLLVAPESPAVTATRLTASLVWMDEQPLELGRRYLLKHTSRIVPAAVIAVEHRLDVATLARDKAKSLRLNEIGMVEIEAVQPLAVDAYTANRTTGSFVLIDSVTNATCAAGMIRVAHPLLATSAVAEKPVSADERAARWGHIGAHVHLVGEATFVDVVERALFVRGAFVVKVTEGVGISALTNAGMLVLTHEQADYDAVVLDEKRFAAEGVENVLRLLREHSILRGEAI